jgi:capsular exopolysaccharide synthesis family protein
VHASLLLSDVDQPPKVIMLTSTVPGEGKTTTAASLGRLLAQAGNKVLLIDADLRRGTCYRHLNLEDRPGLVDILSGGEHAHEAVQLDEASGLHFIATGRDVRNAQDLLSSRAMERLLQKFGNLYDLILIDTPPVTVVSDARFLAPRVEKVLYVTKWNDTRRDVVAASLKKLREGQANIAGVLLSQVNVRRHAKYGYSDSGYFHGRYASYYRG